MAAWLYIGKIHPLFLSLYQCLQKKQKALDLERKADLSLPAAYDDSCYTYGKQSIYIDSLTAYSIAADSLSATQQRISIPDREFICTVIRHLR